MPAGPLQYALGLTYRENGFDFVPDNLSDNAELPRPDRGPVPERTELRRVRRVRDLRRAADPDRLGRSDGRRAFQRRARRPRLGLEHGADAQSRDLQGVDRLGRHSALPASAAASTARSARRTWASSSSGARRSSAASASRDQCSQNLSADLGLQRHVAAILAQASRHSLDDLPATDGRDGRVRVLRQSAARDAAHGRRSPASRTASATRT